MMQKKSPNRSRAARADVPPGPRAAAPSPAPHASLPGPDPSLRFSRIEPEDVCGFVDVASGSFPLFMADRDQALEGFHEVVREGYPELYGGFGTAGRLAGVYAFYFFVATIGGRGIPASGLGMVSTALDRKKQRVALQVVRDYARRTRERGMSLSFLYPFRHDFYGDMGWGAAAESHQYRISPGEFPLYPERAEVRWVDSVDWQALDRIHRGRVGLQGGLGLSRHPRRWGWMLRQSRVILIAGPETAPQGYLLANFRQHPGVDDKFRCDLEVMEMDWATPRAMRALLGFLSTQRDQVTEVVLDWPADGHLDAILRNPVRSNAAHLPGHLSHGPVLALGAMVRLENPDAALRERPYNGDGAVDLEVRTRDPIEPDRAIGCRVRLRGSAIEEGRTGRAARAVLETDLASLSRLWAGSLRFREAVEFGLATVQPTSAVERLDRLFQVPPPWIVERF